MTRNLNKLGGLLLIGALVSPVVAEDTMVVQVNRMTLEQALEFIADDELVEVTPDAIRVRKRFLSESDRKRASRTAVEP